MNKQENESMQNWYKYQTLDGKMDFEDFYSRELKTQNMLLCDFMIRSHNTIVFVYTQYSLCIYIL